MVFCEASGNFYDRGVLKGYGGRSKGHRVEVVHKTIAVGGFLDDSWRLVMRSELVC